MPKIIFDDEHSLADAPAPVRRRNGQFVVGLLILAFIMGIAGGAGSIVLISESGRLRQVLGVTDTSPLSLARTVTEKLVVEESNGFIQTSKKIAPSVVSITTKQQSTDFFGRTFEQDSAGTGFIITSDGLIVTNKHVVGDTNNQYTVVTSDGKSFDATVQARDPFNDLAILKINATGLPVVELGDSDALEVGQWVMAVGNAFGQFNNSVSVGVISAKNRKLAGTNEDPNATSAELTGLLQTDTAINPGNSGGPLVNLKGQVIGINTAIASTTGQSSGVGFAIPVNSIKKAIDSVRKNGTITRPMLGVRYIDIDAAVQKQLSLTVDHGAYIAGSVTSPGVVPGGPAEKAGVQERDIALELNGERIDADHPLANLLVKYSPGDVVTLKVQRKDKQLDIKVTLGEMK